MSNQYYELYLADVFKLTKSLVVKSDFIADAVNSKVQMDNIRYVIPEGDAISKREWKYYQNLAGDYFDIDVENLKDYNYKNNLKVNIIKVVVLTALDIVNQYIDLHDFAYSAGFIFKDPTNVVMDQGVDYIYSFTGGDDNKTRVTFAGDYALGGASELLPGDQIFLSYNANNGKMIIKSLDTLEDIEFTKENLLAEYAVDARLIHSATHDAYYPGSTYFDELVRRYPEQEILIKGIISPVNIDDAIAAKDHQILLYDKLLVEENEISLIGNIQSWINRYFIRWNVPAYSYIDELYVPAHLGIMWLNMPMVIINLRLAACKTHEVHSYHIRQYLASHNKLDKYYDYMTKKQQLFLYRNIRFIQRNSGKEQTFGKLMDKMLTDRTIPLNAWNLNHNVKQIGEKVHPLLPENDEVYLTASTEVLFESLNGLNSDIYKKTNTVLDVLLKQAPLAKDNPENIVPAKDYTEWYFENSQYSNLKTKTLESNMIDYTEAQPYKFSDIVLNHWLYLGWKEGADERPKYNAAITIKHPNTGDDLNLTTLDAFILFLYAFNKSTGNTFESEMFTLSGTDITHQYVDLPHTVTEDSIVFHYKGIIRTEGLDYEINYTGGVAGVTRITFLGDLATAGAEELITGNVIFINYHFNGGLIPNVTAIRIRRLVLPTVAQMMAVVDKNIVDEAYAQEVIANLPSIDSYSSIEAFHKLCREIYHGVLKHRELHALVEDMDIRAYVEQMVDMCYQDVDIDIGNGLTYDAWFTAKEIVIEGLGRGEWLDLAMDILNTATGVVFNRDKSLRRIQESMIGIMSKLSSYSVHFLRQMIDNLIIVDWTAIRFSENRSEWFASDRKQLHIEDIDITHQARAFVNEYIGLPTNYLETFYGQHATTLKPKYTYRAYKTRIINGLIQLNAWQDVTGTDDYTITGNVLTWDIDFDHDLWHVCVQQYLDSLLNGELIDVSITAKEKLSILDTDGLYSGIKTNGSNIITGLFILPSVIDYGTMVSGEGIVSGSVIRSYTIKNGFVRTITLSSPVSGTLIYSDAELEYTFTSNVSLIGTAPLKQNGNDLTGVAKAKIKLTGQDNDPKNVVKNGYYNYVANGNSYKLTNMTVGITNNRKTGVDITNNFKSEYNLLTFIPMANILDVTIQPHIPSGRWIGLPFP